MTLRITVLSAVVVCLAAAQLTVLQAEDKLVAKRLNKLNWLSDTIQTQPSPGQKQSPVVTGVSLQPGGDLLAIVGDDHAVSIYDTSKREFVQQLTEHQDWVRVAKFTPDGNTLITAGNDRTIRSWNMSQLGQKSFKSQRIDSLDYAIFDIAISNDGKSIAAVGFSNKLRIYDLEQRVETHSFDCSSKDIHAVAFSPNDSLIAAAGRDGKVRVWNWKQEKQLTEFKNHSRRIRSLVFQNNHKLISCGDDCLVNITDINNKNTAHRLARHGGKLYAIQLMNDSTLATAGSDNAIYIWNLENNSQIGVLNGHRGTVSCLDSAGSKLVSGSFDTRVRSWNFERNASLQPIKPQFTSPRLGEQSKPSSQWQPVIK